MLERPELHDATLVACLEAAYGLHIARIEFLPLGADLNTAVYRAEAADATTYFVKLRRGAFDETSVTLPRFLSDLGIREIIPPLPTAAGRLWAALDPFTVIVYPFVEGRSGYRVVLSEPQWRAFGAALQRVHTADVPAAIRQRIAHETYPAAGRNTVTHFLRQLPDVPIADPPAQALAAFLEQRRASILDLVARAGRYAEVLAVRTVEPVVCHSDIHAGNLLIDAAGRLFMVDWDAPLLAPKERDLMYIGGAQGFAGHTAESEERLFYRGYGPAQIDRVALAYYRYERIVQDIAVFCEQIFLTAEGGEDRAQALEYVASNWLPDSTIAAAYRADPAAPRG